MRIEPPRSTPVRPPCRGAADPVGARLDRLRAGGNRATGRRLARHRQLQRVGWADEPATSPNRAEKDVSGVRRIPVDGLPVVHRALVLLSPGIKLDAQVHVLVHLHGDNAGYVGTSPRDLAADKDRIEEQLVAAGRPQLVLVLPQGGQGGNYGAVGNLDPREYALAALKQLGNPPPLLGAVLLSGHSGGGFAIKTILDDQVRRRTLSGVVWFDAVQAHGPGRDVDRPGRARQGADQRADRRRARPARRQGDRRRRGAEVRLPLPALLPAQRLLRRGGVRGPELPAGAVRRGRGGPRRADGELARKIAALSEPARKALRERYQVLPVELGTDRSKGPATTGHDNMVGSGALEQAISAMPYGTAVEGGTLARMPARAPRARARSRARQAAARRRRRAARSTPTVALGHADGDPPTGRTLLRRDDIRTALTGRAANAALNAAFDASVRQIGRARRRRARPVARRERQRPDPDARGRVHPGRGPLRARPAAAGRAPRTSAACAGTGSTTPVTPTDEEAGPNEGEATAMSSEMAALRPERRPEPGRRERRHARRDDGGALGADRAPTCRRSRARAATGCSPRRRGSSTV